MMRLKLIGIIFLALLSCDASAYRQRVHMKLTEYAASQSVLANDAIWQQWGLAKSAKFPHPFTKTDFHQGVAFQQNLDYSALLSYGVDAEDTDIGADIVGSEKWWSRAFSHFYNPQANQKLNLLVYTNYTAPFWALETAFVPGGAAIPSQDYSYADAQDYFYKAFAAPSLEERNMNMGKMFQSLGHVVHLVQDMAQPDHTRLDKHCDDGLCVSLYKSIGNDDTSLYEEYTEELLSCSGGGFVTSPIAQGDEVLRCAKLRSWDAEEFFTKKVYIGGYSAPVLSSPVDYWHTEDFKGMADFSSRNFITTDTPYRVISCGRSPCPPLTERLLPYDATNFPYPSGASVTSSSVTLEQLLPEGKLGKLQAYKDYKMNFIDLHTKDNYTGESIVIPRMASYSVFSERLSAVGATQASSNIFSINYFNLEERAKVLLPRAVGYSAGVLNHFFRYQFKVEEQPIASSRSKWKVTNLSNFAFSGCISFYYDASGVRRQVNSTCTSVTIAAKSSVIVDPLVVDPAQNPAVTFYAVALEPTGDVNRPYTAVAATAFQNANVIPLSFRIDEERVFLRLSNWKIGNTSTSNFDGRIEFFYDDLSGGRHFIDSRSASLAAGKSAVFGPLVVSPDANPSKNFYAYMYNQNNGVVALVPFQNENRNAVTPKPCNSDFTVSGRSETVTSIVNLGTKKGTAVLTYDMQTVPDSIFVDKMDGTSIHRGINQSGQVSVNISYDPALFVNQAVYVTIQGNNSPTVWSAKITCPK